MRTCIGGNGQDTTAALLAYIEAKNQLQYADLILIGEAEFPDALWLTNWPTPINWPVMGTFNPADISRSAMKTAVGLEVQSMDLMWTPKNRTFSVTTNPTGATSPLQLAQLGYFDNWRARIWRTVMPTPGDANTFGAMQWFGGRVAAAEVDRWKIKWTLNSFLEVLNQMVPTNVIENTNVRSGYQGAIPVPGDTSIAKFSVIAGSTTTVLIAQCTSPVLNHVYGTNVLARGYVNFDSGGSETLGGVWSAIASNQLVISGGIHYNQITLYTPLPWAPTPGVDTFYVSPQPPVDFSDGSFYGFPYVPAPESTV